MIKITIQDLIDSLRKASANPEGHASAQRNYFSKVKENSVLVNCNTACCIAGDLMLKAHQDSSDEINKILSQCSRSVNPGEWVAEELGLTEVEAILAFDVNTHYEIHALLADILEQGLRLSDDQNTVELSYNSTYTYFDCAYIGLYDGFTTLGEIKNWMRGIAKQVQ
jgi:hypothetical protein